MSLANTSSIIEERLPVWEALSDFFLDTELENSDYQRIARVLAASPYSIQDTEDILKYELYPVLIWNLRSVTGERAEFDIDGTLFRCLCFPPYSSPVAHCCHRNL